VSARWRGLIWVPRGRERCHDLPSSASASILLIFLPRAGWTQQRGAPETATRSLTKPQPNSRRFRALLGARPGTLGQRRPAHMKRLARGRGRGPGSPNSPLRRSYWRASWCAAPSCAWNAASAQAIGLAFHELTTNAGRYGPLSGCRLLDVIQDQSHPHNHRVSVAVDCRENEMAS
jgi:hypothetical protein